MPRSVIFIRVGKGVNAIAARIDPTNSNAFAYLIEAMKKKFDTHADAWGGYVGTGERTIGQEDSFAAAN